MRLLNVCRCNMLLVVVVLLLLLRGLCRHVYSLTSAGSNAL
jgi:hypothetical protein